MNRSKLSLLFSYAVALHAYASGTKVLPGFQSFVHSCFFLKNGYCHTYEFVEKNENVSLSRTPTSSLVLRHRAEK